MASTYLSNIPYGKRVFPLLTALFTGFFCDLALLLLVIGENSVRISNDTRFLPILAAVYALPFLLAAAPAGILADRMPKRGAMLLAKAMEFWILLAAVPLLADPEGWNPNALLVIVFAAGIKTAFFLPAYSGILPETFAEKDLSKAVGDSVFAAAFAGILGLSVIIHLRRAFTGLPELVGKEPAWLAETSPAAPVCIMLCIVSAAAFFLTLRVFPTAVASDRRSVEDRGKVSLFQNGFLLLQSTKSMAFSAYGAIAFLCFFTATGCLFLSHFGISARFDALMKAGDPGTFEMFLPVMVLAAGLGIGGLFCGRLSGGKVECGIVPFGAIAIAVFLPLAIWCPGPAAAVAGSFVVEWAKSYEAGFQAYPLQLLWIFAGGFGCGLFLVPLRAYLLKELPSGKRGTACAVFDAILFALLACTLIQSGIAEAFCGAFRPDGWESMAFNRNLPAWLGFMPLAVTVGAGIFLPRLVIRTAAVLLTHTFYKLRAEGTENIPAKGPALLVSNHGSFADSLLILACTSRRIRFLIHEKFYRHWFIHPFAKMIGSIEVPAGGRYRMEEMFEEVGKALKNGDIVCVFPEGRVSKNGIMGDFKSGYSKMVPEGSGIPLIPVSVGLVWGSMFSYYYGKIRPRFSFSYPARVSFGKPMKLTDADTAFRLRQAVSELETEAAMHPLDDEKTLHYQFAKNAKRHPFRKVVCDYGGKHHRLFGTLVSAVVLSREIRKIAGDSKYVGLMLPNSSALATAILAVLMADKVPSPLNFTVSKDTLRKSLDKAGIRVILTSGKFLEKIHAERIPEMLLLEEVVSKIPVSEKILWLLACVVLPHQELMTYVSPETHRELYGTAVLLFSSGSTGQPKGVMLSHHNVNADVNSLVRVVAWTEKDRMLGSLPLFHSFGLMTSLWLPLMVGCKVVYVLSPLDASTVGKALREERLTILLATPTFILSYLRKCPPESFASVRLAIVGAEKLRKDIIRKFGDITRNGPALIEGYGCTETAPVVSVNVGRDFVEIGKVAGKEGSIGVAMPGISVRIVDPVTREELPPGTDGLLLVKGPIVMQGYLNDPVLTENVISDGWYETGDIAHMDPDGYITISGRLSRFSKIAGEMVPHELLECMMGEIIGRDERVVAVGGIPDKAKGEALVVVYLRGKLPCEPEEMNELLRKHNIPNLWIPKAANYRAVDALPVTGTGKLDLMHLGDFIKKEFQV